MNKKETEMLQTICHQKMSREYVMKEFIGYAKKFDHEVHNGYKIDLLHAIWFLHHMAQVVEDLTNRVAELEADRP